MSPTGSPSQERLSDADIDSMTSSSLDAARRALHDGAPAAEILAHLDRAERRWRSLQDHSVTWIAGLLTFVARRLGEDAVEEALREHGARFVLPRRGAPGEWEARPASERAKSIARAMVANGASVVVDEDDDKITLRFRCGSGGRLVDDGRYETAAGSGDGLARLGQAAARTFGLGDLPVYCAHCAVNNEIQPAEAGGAPTSVEHPTTQPGEPCVHHVYRHPMTAPAETWVRIGREPPTSAGGPS